MSIVSPSGFGGAAFTMRLKKVIELTGGSVEKVNGLPVMTGGDIGLNNYPLFDANYRGHLNGRIIGHFYNWEIGAETIDDFIWQVENRMMEIMPFYNKLYLSEQIAYDPLSTIDIRTLISGTSNTTVESEGATSTEATQGSRTVSSETPQTMLSGNADYATSGVDAGGTSSGSGEATENRSEANENDSDSHVTGFQGPASELVMRYRDSLLNIDLSIVNELAPHFMQLWNTTHPYTPQRGF